MHCRCISTRISGSVKHFAERNWHFHLGILILSLCWRKIFWSAELYLIFKAINLIQIVTQVRSLVIFSAEISSVVICFVVLFSYNKPIFRQWKPSSTPILKQFTTNLMPIWEQFNSRSKYKLRPIEHNSISFLMIGLLDKFRFKLDSVSLIFWRIIQFALQVHFNKD